MERKFIKKDPGTIFNPVMYLMLLFLTVVLLFLFVEYRRIAWLSDRMTDTLTDALLGAAALNKGELYAYGRTDELKILYPEEKYEVFRKILREELGLDDDMCMTEESMLLIRGEVKVKDFIIYSVDGEDVTIYDFDEEENYTTKLEAGCRGVLTAENGMVINETTLVAEIGFVVDFMGVPIEAEKYHMVDVTHD